MPQHVIQRGNNRSACFARSADLPRYSEWLRDACARYSCQLHAYVFMTNHVHLLITPESETSISGAMQWLGRKYVRYFNDVHERTGTLWEGRYKATLVDTEHYLFTCYRYIESNPVRAGMADHPRSYAWSSHRANAYGSADPLVTPHGQYLALGSDSDERRSAYRRMFAIPLKETELSEIRHATNHGWVLGGDSFRAHVASALKRRTEPLWAGRASSDPDARFSPQQNAPSAE